MPDETLPMSLACRAIRQAAQDYAKRVAVHRPSPFALELGWRQGLLHEAALLLIEHQVPADAFVHWCKQAYDYATKVVAFHGPRASESYFAFKPLPPITQRPKKRQKRRRRKGRTRGGQFSGKAIRLRATKAKKRNKRR